MLNAYIKKIRSHAPDQSVDGDLEDLEEHLRYGDASKSERLGTKRPDTTKRNRRANNRSRLYEDEQKLFEDIMKHKNNQSLDTKISKQTPGHLRYTTLLSKDKKLCIDQHNVTSKNMGKEKLKEIKTNKYYSAPVSTKENGLVTRFKFHDKKEDTQRVRDKVDSTEFPEEKKISTKDRISKVTPNDSELDRSNFHSKKRSQESDYNIQVSYLYFNFFV